MVTNVVYAIQSPEMIPEVCGELATAIVENLANQFQVGLLVFGQKGYEYVQPFQKLTVALVNSLRIAAYTSFDNLEGKADDNAVDFSSKVESVIAELPGPINVSIAVYDLKNEHVHIYDNYCDKESLPFGQGRKPVPGPKHVKAVKTFDGTFTVGDPERPLLDIPVVFFPVTRRSSPLESASFVDNRRVVRSSTLKAESGAVIEPETLEKGYMYLNELIPVDKGVQNLMDGEFPGAERWKKAFELLATVPEVPPWLPLEHTDVVMGTTNAAIEFLKAFAEALSRSKMHAIARLCRDPRRGMNGEKKLKGKLELVVLQPSANGQLICSPLPFKEDFKSYYRFAELPAEPSSDELELDQQMDALVDAMEMDSVPAPQRNALIERVALYVRNKIADGEAQVPPVPHNTISVPKDPHLSDLSNKLMSGFGIVERSSGSNSNNPEDANANGSNVEFDFF